MAHQIIFTSLPRTLRGGSGYGIAAQTPNVPNVLSEEITKLAGYVEIYPGKDPNRRFNPINYFFYKFNSWYILGRIISAENDYSGRFNYLGQFFVLEQNELQECGPAAILKDLPFIESFQGEARNLPPLVMARGFGPNSTVCKAWESATGDAGWGGFLAEKIRSNQSAPILYDKTLHGPKALALLAESLNLLSPAERWGTTFSTHVEGFPKGNQVRVRMLQQGGELTREFKNNSAIIDLTKAPLELGMESPLITEARTGERPSAIRQQVLRQPEPAVVVAQADFDDSEPIGLAVEAGMPGIPGQKSKNWVATPPNLTPPKMVKQNRINYGRDTDEYPKETFKRNRKSVVIPTWFWPLLAVWSLVILLLGIFIGTYINKAGMEETQQKVEEQKKNTEETIEKKDNQIKALENKNEKEGEEKKQKTKDLETEKEKNIRLEEENTILKKFEKDVKEKTGNNGIDYIEKTRKFYEEYYAKKEKFDNFTIWLEAVEKENSLKQIINESDSPLIYFDQKVQNLIQSEKNKNIFLKAISKKLKTDILNEVYLKNSVINKTFADFKKNIKDINSLTIFNVDFAHDFCTNDFPDGIPIKKYNSEYFKKKTYANEVPKDPNFKDQTDKNDFIKFIKKLNDASKNGGLIIIKKEKGENEQYKLSTRMIEYLDIQGDNLKNASKELNQELSKELVDIINSIKDLKAK